MTDSGLNNLVVEGIVIIIIAGSVLMAWLVGLIFALQGSKPEDRAEILRAYAFCNPLAYLGKSGRVAVGCGREETTPSTAPGGNVNLG